MGIINKLIGQNKGNDHEVYYIQAPLYQRPDGTTLNDNRSTKRNGFLRIETWRVTQNEEEFGKHINIGFDMNEPIKPGARLSVVFQPEHVKGKTIETIRSAIFNTMGIGMSEGSREQKQKVRGGYATVCLVVKAAKNLVVPKDTNYKPYYQLTVSEVIDWQIHFCTRKSDQTVDLHKAPELTIVPTNKETLKKQLEEGTKGKMKFTL